MEQLDWLSLAKIWMWLTYNHTNIPNPTLLIVLMVIYGFVWLKIFDNLNIFASSSSRDDEGVWRMNNFRVFFFRVLAPVLADSLSLSLPSHFWLNMLTNSETDKNILITFQCFENVFTCSIDIIDDRTCRHSNTCPRNYLLSPKVIVIFEQRIELIVPKFMSPNETNSFNQYEKASEFTIRIL